MGLLDKVCCYFKNVAIASDFIVAVDPTGVYLFTPVGDSDQILVDASSLMDALDINREELVICIVDATVKPGGKRFFDLGADNSFSSLFNEIYTDEFEDAVRRMTGGRQVVFHDRELDEILGCFDRFVQREKKPDDYLADFGLGDDVKKLLDSYVPASVQDVIACGVPAAAAQDVFDAIQEHNRRPAGLSGGARDACTDGMPVMNDRAARNLTVISLIMAAAGFGCEIINMPAAPVVFACIGLWYANDLAMLYRTFWNTISRAFNVAVLLIGVWQAVVFLLPYARDTFERAGMLFRG